MSKLNDKERENLPESAFAFPKERKEPLERKTGVNFLHVMDVPSPKNKT